MCLAETVECHAVGDATIQRLKHAGQTRHRICLTTATENKATSLKLILRTRTVLGLDFMAESLHPVDSTLLGKERLTVLLFIKDLLIEPEHPKSLRKRLMGRMSAAQPDNGVSSRRLLGEHAARSGGSEARSAEDHRIRAKRIRPIPRRGPQGRAEERSRSGARPQPRPFRFIPNRKRGRVPLEQAG